jgi:hypothetical protein
VETLLSDKKLRGDLALDADVPLAAIKVAEAPLLPLGSEDAGGFCAMPLHKAWFPSSIQNGTDCFHLFCLL